ncbi:hypothetical protein [Vibrio parahaemolyticus]|uniref:hypothetical protein n=2 Tax=Vibrionaceae TaxID=641 RepID=UPI001E48D442|nr:hypothetical protein [Vibrio parahaemolyticus]
MDDDVADWLALLKKRTHVSEARVLIKLLGDEDAERPAEKEAKEKVERYTKKIEQLKAFNSISSALVNDLEEQIKKLQEEK